MTDGRDLKAGDKAPDFELMTDAGESVRLSELRGHKVILYFYPEDNTPGCTAQAQDFRDTIKDFKALATASTVSPTTIRQATAIFVTAISSRSRFCVTQTAR